MALFTAFAKTIRNIPTQAVLRALDAECNLLQNDLEHYGRDLTEDGLSIICFGQYVRMVKAA